MYNEDDAVAKLDGYIVSVIGAASLVGERTLVRIDRVGRSAAQASLVDPPPGAAAVAASSSDSDSASASRRRRRGRRGGRRRRKQPESPNG
jgi:ribonuclease G